MVYATFSYEKNKRLTSLLDGTKVLFIVFLQERVLRHISLSTLDQVIFPFTIKRQGQSCIAFDYICKTEVN